MDAVCVFCGSSPGIDPVHISTAALVGQTLAADGIRLVYGGASVGLMGTLADAALDAGGYVVGVIPRGMFRREMAHRGINELIEVETMHERKKTMFELSDAFVALPGGLGTLEELSEILTWAQLGLHGKPIATLGMADYWRPWHEMLRHMVATGFVREDSAALVSEIDCVDDLLSVLRKGHVRRERWIDLAET